MNKNNSKKRIMIAPLVLTGIFALAACGESGSSGNGYDAGRNFFNNFMAADKEWSELLYTHNGEGYFPSHGTAKLLAVPVLMNGENIAPEQIAANKETIRKAFFGEASETTWQSVKSYYETSSYGNVTIDGTVADPITLNDTYASLNSATSSTYYNDVIEEVYDKLFHNEGSQFKGKEADFDGNGDGYIDGIYMVPNTPIDSSKTFGWAWTTRHFFEAEPVGRIKQRARYKVIGTYCWTSILFTTQVASERPSADKPDAHTFIHEMGHQFGLADYYDPDNQGSVRGGGATMQDENVADHDIYSKYLLGWANPTVVSDKNKDGTIKVTLRPSESSGDCLVLGSGLNGTAMDEYIIAEFYTPTGLNEHDSKKAYQSSDQKAPDQPGVRIWHVDKNIHTAHIGYTTDDAGKKVQTTYFDPNPVDKVLTKGEAEGYKIVDDVVPTKGNKNSDDDYYTTFTTNNSKNYKTASLWKSNFYIRPELELVRADNSASGAMIMTNASLFHEGATFGAAGDAWKDFRFYSPAVTLDYDVSASEYEACEKLKLPYSITVESLTEDSATLALNRL